MKSKLLIRLSLFAIFISVASSTIQCYVCFYDANVSETLPTLNKECIAKPFKGDGVKIESGFDKCYKAIVMKDGKLQSAHRGGGTAALGTFTTMTSRDIDEFGISYCKTDLCNGTPSLPTFGLVATLCVALYNVFN